MSQAERLRRSTGRAWRMRCGLLAVSLAIPAASSPPVRAELLPADYTLEKNFTINPGGDLVPIVTWRYFEHAWTIDRSAVDNSIVCTDVAVNPFANLLFDGFNRFGREETNKDGSVSQRPAPGFKPILGSHAVAAAGTGGQLREFALADDCDTKAEGNSYVDVAPFAAGGPVTGSIKVSGAVQLFEPASGYAYSYSAVEVRGREELEEGEIQLLPVIRAFVGGDQDEQLGRGPINFRVEDLVTHAVTTGTLNDILYAIHGPGSIVWEAGLLVVDALNAEFHIDNTSPYTVEQGALDLVITDGVITTSSDSGIFDGVLPGVGAAGAFSVPLAALDLHYDLGDFGGNPVDVALEISSGADVYKSNVVPEPSSVITAGLGVLLAVAIRRRRRPPEWA